MKDKFSISFKNNEKEQAVKEYINTKFNPTAYIKELIYKDMMGQTASMKDMYDKMALDEIKHLPKVNIVDGQVVSATDIETLNYVEQLTKEMEEAKNEESTFGFDPSVNPIF